MQAESGRPAKGGKNRNKNRNVKKNKQLRKQQNGAASPMNAVSPAMMAPMWPGATSLKHMSKQPAGSMMYGAIPTPNRGAIPPPPPPPPKSNIFQAMRRVDAPMGSPPQIPWPFAKAAYGFNGYGGSSFQNVQNLNALNLENPRLKAIPFKDKAAVAKQTSPLPVIIPAEGKYERSSLKKHGILAMPEAKATTTPTRSWSSVVRDGPPAKPQSAGLTPT